MKFNEIDRLTGPSGSTEKMPVLFLGHGSPMNAIEDNVFVEGIRSIAREIPVPKAVLCISAHWETRGTLVTAMEKPPTIHDFGGFPQELFEVQYPAPGSPWLAGETRSLIGNNLVNLDDKWGLDHGCWSVVKHLFPDANIPVVQLSLDYYKTPQAHYELAVQLSALRRKGILITGSGNMVHNLRMVAWDKLSTAGYGYDWAVEANNKMKGFILDGDHKSLINYRSQGQAYNLAIPTPEHYLPLLYALALKEETEDLTFFNDMPVAGSLTMTSLKIG